MKPEQQRRKLGELEGFIPCPCGADGCFINLKTGKSGIPDYLHDLNATNRLEMTLTDDQHTEFRIRLAASVAHSAPRYISATAAQRCEAILRALDLWKDD